VAGDIGSLRAEVIQDRCRITGDVRDPAAREARGRAVPRPAPADEPQPAPARRLEEVGEAEPGSGRPRVEDQRNELPSLRRIVVPDVERPPIGEAEPRGGPGRRARAEIRGVQAGACVPACFWIASIIARAWARSFSFG
jgi:hypothetical protein